MSSPDELARWHQIEHIYHSALQLHEGEREAFLRQACEGDESLCEEVVSLIAAYESSGSFMKKPAMSIGMKLLACSDEETLLGCHIGPYEILSLIGRGGMGDVYLAQDSRLGRKIAFKLLPFSLSNDDDSIKRFMQEARSASTISHPNIAHIYEIGVVENHHYMTMEYVDGVTLRQRMKEGRIELWQSIDIALQVGVALSAAHASGIVHRDIKPENIMLRRDGYIKVLDFGLAKLTERQLLLAGGKTDASLVVKTEPGIVLGTASYMSPEQVRGLDVDARSDIWSLGCVLYEMVAGKLPFSGATKSDLFVSVLEREPRPLTHLKFKTPFEFWRVIKKALCKNQDERYQAIEEMMLDLKHFGQSIGINARVDNSAEERLNDSVAATDQRIGVETLREEAVITRVIRKKRLPSNFKYLVNKIQQHKRTVGILAAFSTVIAVLIIGKYILFQKNPPKPTASSQIMKIARLTSTGKSAGAAISPNGKIVVYIVNEAGQRSLWVRQVATTRNLQIVEPAAVDYFGITISPDGNHVYYVTGQTNNPIRELSQVSVLGGAPKKLLTDIDSPVTFSPDGKLIAFMRGDMAKGEWALMITNVDGTGEKRLTVCKSPVIYAYPAWSPDGKSIAVSAGNNSAGKEMTVVAVNVEDGTERPLTSEKWLAVAQVAWLADGSGMVISAVDKDSRIQQLWQLSYPEGTAKRLTNDLNNYAGISLASETGDLITIRYDQSSNIWITPIATQTRALRNGTPIDTNQARQITSGATKYYGVSWTPDGRIVFSSDVSGRNDLWIMDQDGVNQKQLTADAGDNFQPTVSPDGRTIVFVSDRKDVRHNLWRMDIDGNNVRQLTSGNYDRNPTFSPDGKWIIYASMGVSQPNLWRVSIDGGEAVKLTDKYSIAPTVSPDGKTIACYYWDGNPESQLSIALIPFEGGQPMKTFTLPSAVVRWTPDGSALTYVDSRSGVSNVWSQPVDGGKPVQLTDFKFDLVFSFDWARDGRQLAVARGIVTSDVILAKNFR